jgi:hypothetical protein
MSEPVHSEKDVPSGEEARRDQFLVAMYHEMWSNINRHILVVWQSAGLLASTFAAFALVASKAMSLDFAISLIAGTTAWFLAHLVDANYWFSRNLAIIINIERQFLRSGDLSLIHPYFRRHRKPKAVLEHVSIQACLGLGVWAATSMYHLWHRVVPGIGAPWSTFELARAAPYVTSAISFGLLWRFCRRQRRQYERFLRDAPGLPVRLAD